MLSRDRKVPPSTSLAVSNGTMSARRIDRQQLRPDDARLRRAGPVDQQDLCARRARRRSGEGLRALRRGRRSPASEALLKQRLDLAQRPVGHDENLAHCRAAASAARSRRSPAGRIWRSPSGRRPEVRRKDAPGHRCTVGSRRCATRVGSFCCCAIAVSFCDRMRSMSPVRNAASLVTSVIRSSDGARFGESALSSTYERSRAVACADVGA